MANPEGTQGMTIAKTTYEKLKALKKENETFDDVVRKLVAMDQKYNSKPETIEFEFMTENNSKLFRVTFANNSHDIEFYGKGKFIKNIKAWDNFPPISNEDKNLFIGFISKEASYFVLQTLESQVDYGNFLIRKVG